MGMLNIYGHTLVCEIRLWENGPRLAQQLVFVIIARAVMAQQQLAHMGSLGHLGSLSRRAVKEELGPFGIVTGVGALMIERRHAAHQLVQLGQIAGIRAISIAPGLVGRHGGHWL